MVTSFEQVVASESELRALLGQPTEKVLTKGRAVLDERATIYIGERPFVLIASSDAQGSMDISPKGDVPFRTQIPLRVRLKPRNRWFQTYHKQGEGLSHKRDPVA